MRALLYADSGPDRGLGHLRRSTALAHGLRTRGWTCAFLTTTPTGSRWLIDHGHPVAGLSPERGRLPALPDDCDLFVLDSYDVTNDEARRALAGRAGVVLAFDDDMSRTPVADIILSSGVGAQRWPWPGRDGILYLLGPGYHPLSAEFIPPRPRSISDSVSRVLLTFGASGGAVLLRTALDAVRSVFRGAELDVILGPFLETADIGPASPGLRLHGSVDVMARLMTSCDLAVSGSGQTVFELAATGTPAVALTLSPNQQPNARWMAEAGALLDAGAADSPETGTRLTAALRAAAPRAARTELSRRGQSIIDGLGAFRVEEAVSALLEKRRAHQ